MLHPKASQLSVFNTLSGKREVFEPLNSPFVGMYVCGPTVYSDVHLGNVRSFTTFDVLNRYLTVLGYKVRYVRNITDVGHLLNDADEGEDKIGKIARLEKLEPMEIVQRYTNGFREVMRIFNLLPPSIEPTATGHIIDQINMIKKIIDNGYAYEANGSVYFDVVKYNGDYPYGELSNRKIEEMIENTRDLDGQSDKKSPLDFALWKKADDHHIMRWPSPWSEGFPGWHLECSVMSTKYLGETFDIHGGGMDLKFPHHECEIAQSKAADGNSPVRYWMHGNMLTVNGQKMSKSLGNAFLPHELISGEHPLLDKGYSPSVIRFFMLQSHYASTLDFSNEALGAAEKGFQKLSNSINLLDKISYSESTLDNKMESKVKGLIESTYNEMNDDLNTAKLIAVLFEMSSIVNSFHNNQQKVGSISQQSFNKLKDTMTLFFFDVLGLKIEQENNSERLEGIVELLIELRKSARENKDWAMSDKIRDDLQALGVQLKDEKSGGTSFTLVN